MTDKYVFVEALVRDENGENPIRWVVKDTKLAEVVEEVENHPNIPDKKFVVLADVCMWDSDE